MRTGWLRRWTACTNELARASARILSRRLILGAIASLTVATWIVIPTAQAQHLDLDGPPAPALGDLSALVELGVRLARERDEAAAQADASTDPALGAGFRLRASMRDLALALLATGAEHHRFGALGALAGLRVNDALVALDAIASEATDAALAGHRAMRDGSADAEAIANWERARAATDALTRRCEALAHELREQATGIESVADLDGAVAHALAELRRLIPEGDQIEPAWPAREAVAWMGSVEAAAVAIDGIAMDQALITAATQAFEALRAGEAAPEVRRHRRATAWRIVDAVRAAELLTKAHVAPGLAPGVVSACEAIADPVRRAAGIARIEAIAALGALGDRAVALEAEGVDIGGVREAMGVIAIGLSAPIEGGTPQPDAETRRVVNAIMRLVEDVSRAPRRATLDFRDGKFNRAWRELVQRHEGVEQRAFELAAKLARAPGVLGTPEAASAATMLSNSTGTLLRIASLADWIAELRSGPSSGTVGPTRAGAADRLTVIRRAIGYEEHRDAALAELAIWEQMRPLVLEMPAEHRLRDGDPRLSAPTRSRGPAVVRVMDVIRAAWLSSWARADEIASIEATGRIDLVQRLGNALIDAASLRDDDLAPRVSRWAGLRITPEALGELRIRSEAVLGEAVSAAIDAQYERLGALLNEWDESCIGARMVARLGAASASRPDWPTAEGAAGLVATLGAPPPADAWLVGRRADLAALSVWAAELDGATARGDRGMADAIVAWINHLAEPVLQELPD